MISRFVEGERLINVKFFEGVGTKPRDTYNSLKAEGRFAKPSTSTPMARPVYFPFVKERTLISPEPFLAAPHAQEKEPKSPRTPVPYAQPAPDPRLDPSNPDYDYDAWETREIVRLLEEQLEEEAQNALANKHDEKDK
jgi:hypothetical protein